MSERAKLRTEIAKKAGCTEDRYDTALSKSTLNSIHAYLTGEFVVYPEDLMREWADSKPEVKEEVAYAALLVDYLDHREAQKAGEVSDRPFNISELRDILDNMERIGDQRDWSGEEKELMMSYSSVE